MNYIDAALVVGGLIVGAKLPDVDLAPLPVWRHRSAWTHGALFPALIYLAAQTYPGAWWLSIGLLPTLILHLVADCLPKHWRGAALIKFFPLAFSLNAVGSIIWIATGAAAGGYVLWLLTGSFIMGVIR